MWWPTTASFTSLIRWFCRSPEYAKRAENSEVVQRQPGITSSRKQNHKQQNRNQRYEKHLHSPRTPGRLALAVASDLSHHDRRAGQPESQPGSTPRQRRTFHHAASRARVAGLKDTVATGGTFTILAPTDDAFAALPPGRLNPSSPTCPPCKTSCCITPSAVKSRSSTGSRQHHDHPPRQSRAGADRRFQGAHQRPAGGLSVPARLQWNHSSHRGRAAFRPRRTSTSTAWWTCSRWMAVSPR